jgi:penicillin-insensitive murein endopeptidase
MSRPRRLNAIVFGGALLGLTLSAPLPSAQSEHELPDRFERAPFSHMSLTVGYPNDGWQMRAKRLRRSQFLHIKDNSRDHSYGHPALVLMLERSAREVARAARGSVMVVGDLSRREGGPLSGHVSHQSGRDADIAFYIDDARGKPFEPDAFVAFGPDGVARDGSGLVFDDRRNWLLLKSWARDRRAGLAHIFVESHLRQRILQYGATHNEFKPYVTQVAALLKQPEAGSTHDDHFHVRIACPKRLAQICREESR